ncbi:MAG: CBS domain-containing protein [Myxococcota bacterium]
MSTQLVTLSVDESVSLAEQLMRAMSVRHLPVLGEGDQLVGVVSDRDLLAAAASSLDDEDAQQARAKSRRVPVDEIMTRSVRVAEPTTPLLDAAVMMREHKISCLPVVEDGALVGLLTETDLVNVLINALQSPGSAPHATPQQG